MSAADVRELYQRMKPLIIRDIANGTSNKVTITGGGGGVSDHGLLSGLNDDDHLHYHTNSRGDARYYLSSAIDTWRTAHLVEDAHHNRTHSLTSSSDHDFTGSWAAGEVLVGTGASATVRKLNHSEITSIGEDQHHNRAHDIITASDHTITAAQYSVLSTWGAANTLSMTTATNDVSAGHLLLKSDASGGFTAEQAVFNTVIDTPKITSPDTLNLAAGEYIWTNKRQRTGVFGPNFPINGAQIDWGTGEAWFDKLTANEMHVELFVADFIRATVGKQWWSRSVALTSREFIVPPDGESAQLWFENIPGIPSDWQAFVNGNTVVMRYADLGENKNVGISVLPDSDVETGSPAGGSPTVHYGEEDFEGFSIGGDPTDWTDTDVNNDTDTQDLWDVQSVGGSQAFGTTNSGNNFHTHWTGTGYASLTGYCVTGRFRIGSTSDGWGFTVGSDYPNSDAYYRVRAYSASKAAHATTHGAPTISGGTSTSSFEPSVDTWYNYKIELEDTGSRTELRARFWTGTEPATWDIDCYDTSGGRRTAGTFGMWAHALSDEFYVDDVKCESLDAGGGSGTVVLSPSPDIGLMHDDVLVYTVIAPGASAAITTPTGFTLAATTPNSSGAFRMATYAIQFDESFDNPDVTITNADDTCFCYVWAIRGAKFSGWGSSSGSGSATSVTIPGLTVNNDKSMILTVVGMPNSDDMTLNRVGSTGLDEYIDDRSTPTGGFALFGRYCETGGYYDGDSVDWGSSAYYVRHSIDMESIGIVTGGADIGSVVGTINSLGTHSSTGEQYGFFTPLSGKGYEGIKIGSNVAIVDFGTVGDPFILMDAVSTASPVLEMSSWTSGNNPLDSGNTTTHIVLGRLDEYTGGGTDEFGLMAYSSAQKNFKLSTDGFELHGIPIDMYTGATNTGRWTAAGDLKLGSNIGAPSTTGFDFVASSGNLTIGDFSGNNGMQWDETAGTLTVRGAIDIQSGSVVPWAELTGVPGGTDIDNMFVGAPSGSGLMLTDTQLGYYAGGKWITYLDNSGNFLLRQSTSSGVTNRSMYWNGTDLAFYDSSSVKQAYISAANGKIWSGGGKVSISDDGINLTHHSGTWTPGSDDESAITWNAGDAAIIAGDVDTTEDYRFFDFHVEGTTGEGFTYVSSKWSAELVGESVPYIYLESNTDDNDTTVEIKADNGHVHLIGGYIQLDSNDSDLIINGDLDLNGTIRTTSNDDWDLNDYSGGGTLTAQGRIQVTINGTNYFILARTT